MRNMPEVKRLRIVKDGILETVEYNTISGKIRKEVLQTWDKLQNAPAISGYFEIVIKPFVNGAINGVDLELHERAPTDKPYLKLLGQGVDETLKTKLSLLNDALKPEVVVNPPKPTGDSPPKPIVDPKSYHEFAWYRDNIRYFFKTNGVVNKSGTYNELTTDQIYEKFEVIMKIHGTIEDLKVYNKTGMIKWRANVSKALSYMTKQSELKIVGSFGNKRTYKWVGGN